ncbi:MAG: hypothetical protein EOM73_04265 [Bacteroidia bacterium]|nr:hypothetical protein [Bacteroidia bacterium]
MRVVADIVAKRKELNQRAADIDLNGPAFMMFQKLCFEKMVDALNDLNTDEETIQLVLTKWAERMENWGKELKRRLDDMAE